MTDTALAPDPAPRRGLLRVLVLLPVLVFAALAGLFLYRLRDGHDPQTLPSALIGQAVPSFRLPPLEGLRSPGGTAVPGLAAGDLRGDRVTILNVWASWCAPCRVEHPHLMALASDPSVRLVGIDYKDKPETARRFLGTFGNPFAAVGFDELGRAGIELGVYGVPETFVIDRAGTIRHRHVGPLTPETLPAFMDRVKAAAR